MERTEARIAIKHKHTIHEANSILPFLFSFWFCVWPRTHLPNLNPSSLVPSPSPSPISHLPRLVAPTLAIERTFNLFPFRPRPPLRPHHAQQVGLPTAALVAARAWPSGDLQPYDEDNKAWQTLPQGILHLPLLVITRDSSPCPKLIFHSRTHTTSSQLSSSLST